MNRFDNALQMIRKHLPQLEIRENEPMSRHTSFRIGGPVRAMAIPRQIAELSDLCDLLRLNGITPLVIGNGTNLLVSDSPLEHFVIKTSEGLGDVRPLPVAQLSVECGVTLARAAAEAQALGLTGLEFAHGIPGTVGGAVTMNAGAYGGEMKDIVCSTIYLDENLTIRELEDEEHAFGYRRSAFTGTNKIVLRTMLRLQPGSPEEIAAKMRELAERRRESQPLEKASAGSFFKRPANGYAAALIDECGLKGYAVGGAQVSEKHAGFIVNNGGATFSDVRRVMDHVRDTVYERTGTILEPEVRIITA